MEAVHRQLASKGLCLREDWLQACLQDLGARAAGANAECAAQMVLERVLAADLAACSQGTLPHAAEVRASG
jgi:hypothetical protein